MGLSKAYLILYNVLQVAGWTSLLLKLAPYLSLQMKNSKASLMPAPNPESLYQELGFELRLLQTAALLEVLHAALGLVRSNPIVVATQIVSRLAVLWLPVHHIKGSQTSPGISIMLTAWSVTEVIRYSYYAVGLCQFNISILTWLRYTLFIVLYPMGVTGELWCYYDSLPSLRSSNYMRLDLPNKFNFTFNLYAVTLMVMLYYIPGFPPMYFHMFAQRKKVLGGGASEAKKTA